MRRHALAALVTIGSVAWSSSALLGQQPTFRARVDLVQIDVVVVDAQGNPVSGLTAADFELSEDDTPQTIATFATVDIPLERADRSFALAAESDVASNGGREGRLFLIAFDDGLSAGLALKTREFLRTFIEDQMGDNDAAGIAYLGKGAGNSQDFTSNKRLLLAQLDKFSGGFLDEPIPGAPPPGSETQARFAALDAIAADDADTTGNTMSALRDVTEFLATIDGRRKAMLFITTGHTLPRQVDNFNDGNWLTALFDQHPGERDGKKAMIAAARGNVAIYPINPEGLGFESGVEHLETGIEMRALAEATGGFAILNQNTFDAGLARIVRENSSYYMLGYYSSNEKLDGRFRSVTVRVRRPGLEVRTRNGYVAQRPDAETRSSSKRVLTAEVLKALSSPVARSEVGMKVFAAPYRGSGKDAVVRLVIQLDPWTLGLTSTDGVLAGELELAITATSGRKKYPGVYHIGKMALKPATFAAAERHGLRAVTDIRLPAGTYQIRVAAGNRANKAGSLVADVEVPDFKQGPLALSGLSLASRHLPASVTFHAGTALVPRSSPPPTTSREFDRDETIQVFAEVYAAAKPSTSDPVEIVATLRAPDGRVIATATARPSSAELRASPRGYGFSAELPLAGAAPGPHLVHVEARGDARRPPVSRDVAIRVR